MEWGQVAEAFESGSVVVANEALKEAIAIVMRDEEPMRYAAFRLTADGLDNAAIEAFDESIGLRPEWPGEPMLDFMLGADAIEGMPAGRPVARAHLTRIRRTP